jgi:hypothetical protein
MAEAVAVVRAVRRRKGHRAGHALWSLVASREFSHLRLWAICACAQIGSLAGGR